jgi:competence protein ComEC
MRYRFLPSPPLILHLSLLLLAGCAGGTGGGSGAHVEGGTKAAQVSPRVAGEGAPDTPRAAGPGAASDSIPPTALYVHLLRVSSRSGGGDAILIADSTIAPARHILIDAGDDRAAAAQLAELGVSALDLVVLTHAHHDHYGGLGAVLHAVPVRVFASNGQVRTAVTYRRLLERIDSLVPAALVVDSLRTIRLGAGDSATVLTLIPPRPEDLATDTNDGRRLNNGSLAVRLDRGRFSFLTTGDAQVEANRRFANEFAELVDVAVLKAGHHGAANATQDFWLDAVSPEVVLISANGTTHPHTEALALIAARGIPIYCTPQHGRITLRVERDGDYAIQTREPAERRCEPGSER